MNEIRAFHPMVAAWLAAHEYDYIHEYAMPDYGRVDFFATHRRTGEQLVVECKPNYDIRSGIIQVAGYRIQIPHSKAVIATIKGNLKPKHFEMGKKYDVEFLEFDVPNQRDSKQLQDTDNGNSIESQSTVKAAFLHRLMHSPERVRDEILAYHENHGSSPVFDLLLALIESNHVLPEIYPVKLVDNTMMVFLSILHDYVDSIYGDDIEDPTQALLADNALQLFRKTTRSYVLADGVVSK